MRPKQNDVARLINYFSQTSFCGAHSSGSASKCNPLNHNHSHVHNHQNCNHNLHHLRQSSSNNKTYDSAFEFKSSNLRFGRGITSEVGMDLVNFGVKKVCVMTDSKMVNLPPVITALEALKKEGVKYDVYDQVRVEPTDTSFLQAIDFAKKGNFDGFLAIGGGSVMDTCKVANLYSTYKDNELMDFVNAPIGKGLTIPADTDKNKLKPLIAIPTTTGTGSETTGTAVFDLESLHCKTGITDRRLVPNLGLIDPNHTIYQPKGVVISSGFDVLCHALESYTTLSYYERSPYPLNPKLRPGYQGANPISDIWCQFTLPIINKYFIRAVNNNDDIEARTQMQYASCFAGMGFGTAGVHLCHGMSYPISGINNSTYPNNNNNNNKYVFFDYEHLNYPIIPHGVSVILSAPAVFNFTVYAKPQQHRQAAIWLGIDENSIKFNDYQQIGLKLSEKLLYFMREFKVPNGLKYCGFNHSHIDQLVQGTLPQKRLTNLSPIQPVDQHILAQLFERAMSYQ